MMRRHRLGIPILAGVVVAAALITVFVLDPFGNRVRAAVDTNDYGEETQETASIDLDTLPDWMKFELVDAATGETFAISDFIGKPILIESFAVWCSTCLRQQKEMARLIELEGDSIVHVSLNTDPNEDLEKVRDHVELHGFEWYYAVTPIEMTQLLIDEFGLTVVNAPLAPVILIEADGSARLLNRGVKSAEKLLEEIGPLTPTEGADG